MEGRKEGRKERQKQQGGKLGNPLRSVCSDCGSNAADTKS